MPPTLLVGADVAVVPGSPLPPEPFAGDPAAVRCARRRLPRSVCARGSGLRLILVAPVAARTVRVPAVRGTGGDGQSPKDNGERSTSNVGHRRMLSDDLGAASELARVSDG
jgi:hypothetical protein